MTSMDTLSGLGLIGDLNDGEMSGLFTDIIGGIFGGGKSKQQAPPPPVKAGGGSKISPLTVGLVGGGALLLGAIAVGVFKGRR